MRAMKISYIMPFGGGDAPVSVENVK